MVRDIERKLIRSVARAFQRCKSQMPLKYELYGLAAKHFSLPPTLIAIDFLRNKSTIIIIMSRSKRREIKVYLVRVHDTEMAKRE